MPLMSRWISQLAIVSQRTIEIHQSEIKMECVRKHYHLLLQPTSLFCKAVNPLTVHGSSHILYCVMKEDKVEVICECQTVVGNPIKQCCFKYPHICRGHYSRINNLMFFVSSVFVFNVQFLFFNILERCVQAYWLMKN